MSFLGLETRSWETPPPEPLALNAELGNSISRAPGRCERLSLFISPSSQGELHTAGAV